jgi:hypothetical protein
MAYYSEMVFAIDRRARAQLLVEHVSFPSIFNETDRQYSVTSQGDTADYWVWQNLRWSRESPEIIAFENFMSSLDDIAFVIDAPYGVVRIGDDTDDAELWGAPWEYDIYTHREIRHPQAASDAEDPCDTTSLKNPSSTKSPC